ncbi:uncharacterized protein BJX67DRAFT_256238 [Aspergillus lucknowensis]|uniref:Serine/arginine repetitive matrix protein 2 n=1 Tax=Aspergillus lucknowensis TaxID=176173 RepID=A0ABR4LFZ2_9EURO
MDWDRTRRFDEHRGGESYRPTTSRGYRRSRSPPRIRSPPNRLVADTWVPSSGRAYGRARSRSPPHFRRRVSRSPQPYSRDGGLGQYSKPYNSRRFSPRRDVRPRSPLSSSRRPRSPYGENETRDVGWNRSTSTSRHLKDSSPPGREHGYSRGERRPPSVGRYTRPGSPSRRGTLSEDNQRPTGPTRARSPLYGDRKERATAAGRLLGRGRQSRSPDDSLSWRPSAPGSIPNSRRSSPIHDKSNAASRSTRSRSPFSSHPQGRHLSRERSVFSGQSDRTSIEKSKVDTPEANSRSPTTEQGRAKSTPNQDDLGLFRAPETQGKANCTKVPYTSNIPSQPKAFAKLNHKSPPPGPPHGPKTFASHPRASNISLLSAPTRPRGGSSFKESSWAGPSVRRGPTSVGDHDAPVAPRSALLPAPGAETPRSRSYRPDGVSGAPPSHSQRYPNHLAGLDTIIPGGKIFSSGLGPITEKRLSQLDTDKDRLFEQNSERQKLKRIGLRDWGKLDRESSMCALKSELAEGHLQCVTDAESTLGKAMF